MLSIERGVVRHQSLRCKADDYLGDADDCDWRRNTFYPAATATHIGLAIRACTAGLHPDSGGFYLEICSALYRSSLSYSYLPFHDPRRAVVDGGSRMSL